MARLGRSTYSRGVPALLNCGDPADHTGSSRARPASMKASAWSKVWTCPGTVIAGRSRRRAGLGRGITPPERLRRETGVAIDVLGADLTSPAELAEVEARLRSDQRIGILMNNAGGWPVRLHRASSRPVQAQDWRRNSDRPSTAGRRHLSLFSLRGLMRAGGISTRPPERR